MPDNCEGFYQILLLFKVLVFVQKRLLLKWCVCQNTKYEALFICDECLSDYQESLNDLRFFDTVKKRLIQYFIPKSDSSKENGLYEVLRGNNHHCYFRTSIYFS